MIIDIYRPVNCNGHFKVKLRRRSTASIMTTKMIMMMVAEDEFYIAPGYAYGALGVN